MTNAPNKDYLKDMRHYSLKSKFVVVSVVALAIITPITVKYITENPTSTVKYAESASASSITLNKTDKPLSIGSTITFSVSYPREVKNPRIEVVCHQDNKMTYIEGGSVTDKFLLGDKESRWFREYPNDPAECMVSLYHLIERDGKQMHNNLATTNFSVSGK